MKLLVISILLVAIMAADMVICDADILKPKDSDLGDLKFSDLVLSVYTNDGFRKEEGACTDDGHCFVPVEGIDSFKLKVEGISGVKFTPEFQEVTVKNGDCGTHSFKFKGFGISSKIISKGSSGPNGVKITLADGTRILRETETTNGGRFEFDEVDPGRYTITASKPGLTFNPQEIDCMITISEENTCTTNKLVVTGFEIIGKMESYEEELKGVKVYLYSDTLSQSVNDPESPLSKNLIQVVPADSKGNYKFTNVPNGDFYLAATIAQTTQKMKVQQEQIKVQINDDNLRVSENFKIYGFSIVGKVTTTTSTGIEGVSILIDGQEKVKTNANGNYQLDEVNPGRYIIEAQHSDFIFEPMDITITPEIRELPDIKVNEYKVCGKVSIQDNQFTSKDITILLQETSGKLQSRVQTNNEGGFCFDVKPGDYYLKPQIPTDDFNSGLRLTPSMHEIKVVDQTVRSIKFVMAKVNLSGFVKCLEQSSCVSKKVTLQSSHHTESTTADETGAFSFNQILPGEYTLNLEDPSGLYCYDQSHSNNRKITVEDTDLSDVSIIQSGYQIQYESSFATTIEAGIEGENSPLQSVDIQTGSNHFCLNRKGQKAIIKPSGCVRYAQEYFTYDFTNPSPLQLNPTHFQVSGTVNFDSETQDVGILASANSKQTQFKTTSNGNSIVFEEYFPRGETVTVNPQALSSDSDLLFYPSEAQITVNECMINSRDLTFQAKKGLVFKGQIKPEVDEVQLTLKKKNGEVVLSQSVTGSSYKLQPVHKDQDYELILEKEGYQFTEISTGNWQARVLSYLSVSIIDQDDQALSNVFVQISGGQGMRKVVHSDSNGKVSFVDLLPGKYSLTLLLKEYTFEPKLLTVEIDEGQQIFKTVQATKYLYSTIGKVSYTSGHPIRDARIVAQSTTSDHAEQAISDEDGAYRIRGLNPEESYEVKIIDFDTNRVDRISPLTQTVDISKQDVTDVNFYGFKRSKYGDIVGFVSIKDQENTFDPLDVTIELLEQGKTLATEKLGLARYFKFSVPITKDYQIKVTYHNGPFNVFEEQTQEVTFKGKDGSIANRVEFDIELTQQTKAATSDVDFSQIYGILIGFPLMLLFIFREKIFGKKDKFA